MMMVVVAVVVVVVVVVRWVGEKANQDEEAQM